MRVVPLQIVSFTARTSVRRRMESNPNLADRVQTAAVEIWSRELERRFTKPELALNIADVPIR